MKNSADWNGFMMIGYNIVVITLLPFFPLFIVVLEFDPFYPVFELLLPSPYDRNLVLILSVTLIRILLCTICYFEFVRFGFIFVLASLCAATTALNYLKKLKCRNRVFECATLRLYNLLRILTKLSDYFLRNLILLLIFCSQVLLTSIWWLCIACWNILPGYVSASVFSLAFLCTSIMIILFPRAVEVSDLSEQLVQYKKSMFYTRNPNSKSKYYLLQWNSQRMLPIRCGVLFTVNKNTPMNYYSVLINNFTNAILLIHP